MQNELVSFANMACSIFWSSIVKDTTLPGSVRGKLGGRSQRRLSSSATTAVLQAVCSLGLFCLNLLLIHETISACTGTNTLVHMCLHDIVVAPGYMFAFCAINLFSTFFWS